MSARAAVSSEGSTGAEGFASKVVHNHAWQIHAGRGQGASVPSTLRISRKLLEHPDSMVAGPPLVTQKKAEGSPSTSMTQAQEVTHCPFGRIFFPLVVDCRV